jgi:hypothetical protein
MLVTLRSSSLSVGLAPRSFGERLKTWRINPPPHNMFLKVYDVVVTDKKHMAELFNHHFVRSGFLFDSAMPPCPSKISSSPTLSNATIPDASPSFSSPRQQSFSMQAVTDPKVLKKLLKLDLKKTPRSDGLDPFLFKVATHIIAKPISNLFNLSG